MAVAVGAGGCGEDDYFGWQDVAVDDPGTICLVAGDGDDADAFIESGASASQTFESGADITLLLGLALSTKCTRDVVLTPTLSGWGGEVNVSSEGEWQTKKGVGCGIELAYYGAALEDLAYDDGTYTVSYDGETMELVIPGTQFACLGVQPFGRDVY